jgi:hypothetical protein
LVEVLFLQILDLLLVMVGLLLMAVRGLNFALSIGDLEGRQLKTVRLREYVIDVLCQCRYEELFLSPAHFHHNGLVGFSSKGHLQSRLGLLSVLLRCVVSA